MLGVRRVLVTGSAGFVGRHLSSYLLEREYEVVGVDVAHGEGDVEFHLCDVTRKGDLERGFDEFRPDFVVHLAALCNAKESDVNPYPTFMVNSFGTLNVLECCTRFGAGLLFMSTAAVLGNRPSELPVTEANWEYKPLSGYARSKVIAEHLVRQYVVHKGLKATIFRSWDLIGEGSRGSVVSSLLALAEAGEPITLYCFGEQLMDVNYVGNLCRAVELVMENEGVSGELFHVGSGRPVTLRWIVERIVEYSNSTSKIEMAPPREGEIPIESYPSIEKARAMLGYEPKVTVEEALMRTVVG